MNEFRVTKYDPANRNSSGAYVREEWTSFSDVGRSFCGKEVTKEEYAVAEDSYVRFALALLAKEGIDRLRLEAVEIKSPIDDPSRNSDLDVSLLRTVCAERIAVGDNEIRSIIVANLREMVWCKLEQAECYFHFGYDFYMYVGTAMPARDVSLLASGHGLFAELHHSPYRTDE